MLKSENIFNHKKFRHQLTFLLWIEFECWSSLVNQGQTTRKCLYITPCLLSLGLDLATRDHLIIGGGEVQRRWRTSGSGGEPWLGGLGCDLYMAPVTRHRADLAVRRHSLLFLSPLNRESISMMRIHEKNQWWTYRLQNQTLTTSFSRYRVSLIFLTSSEVGFGFCKKAFSKEYLMLFSIEVRFFLLFPSRSWQLKFGTEIVEVPSASANHFWSKGLSLHMLLKLRLSASNLEIVVCEKSFPYILPMARPTSPWV